MRSFLLFYNAHTLLVSISYLNFVYKRFMPKQQIIFYSTTICSKVLFTILKPFNTTKLIATTLTYTSMHHFASKSYKNYNSFSPNYKVKNLTSTLSTHRNLATKKKTKECPFFGFPIFFQHAWFSFEFTLFLFICK
jgi:hypothetical protein